MHSSLHKCALPFNLCHPKTLFCNRSDHVIKYSETAFSNSNVNYFWSIKHSSEVIEKLRLRNFRGSQVSSFDFSTYTPHCHMILLKQKCCLLSTGVSTESQKRTSVLQLRRIFLATRNMTRINGVM